MIVDLPPNARCPHCGAPVVVAAWGANKALSSLRPAPIPAGIALSSLGTTKDGSPRHPLYVRGDAIPSAWSVIR